MQSVIPMQESRGYWSTLSISASRTARITLPSGVQTRGILTLISSAANGNGMYLIAMRTNNSVRSTAVKTASSVTVSISSNVLTVTNNDTGYAVEVSFCCLVPENTRVPIELVTS